jgi:HEAT repeat protein
VGAAARLARLRSDAPGDDDARERAEATLRAAIRRGAPNDRIEAIVASPIGPDSIEALRIAREDPDRNVATVAHARLATVGDPNDRTAALDALLATAGGAGVERWRALAALAALAEPRSTPMFVELAKANDPEVRARAARWLVQSGAMREATPLLTDNDAAVRRVAACAVLRAPR